MTDYLPGYDAWLTREPEYAEEPLPDEDELPEPTVEEVWDGARGEYVHVVTFASGNRFHVQLTRSGPFVGDYEIQGPHYFADGYLDPQDAIQRLTDPERRDW